MSSKRDVERWRPAPRLAPGQGRRPNAPIVSERTGDMVAIAMIGTSLVLAAIVVILLFG